MSSGLIIDRVVECGRDGHTCTFSLAHSWASGEAARPLESEHVNHYGFRDYLDTQVVAEYQGKFPDLRPEHWPTMADRASAACGRLTELLSTKAQRFPGAVELTLRRLQTQPFDELEAGMVTLASASHCVYWVTGSPDMVQELMGDQAFRDAWVAAIQKAASSL